MSVGGLTIVGIHHIFSGKRPRASRRNDTGTFFLHTTLARTFKDNPP